MKKSVIVLFILFIGTALSAIAGFATKIIIARNTTPEVFGNYSTILATITTLMPLCGFGIQQYWLKTFGQHGAYGVIWIKPSLIFVAISSITIFIILILWFMLTLDSYYIKLSAMVLTFIVFNNVGAELLNSTLQLEAKYNWLAIWQLFQSSFLLVGICILLYVFGGKLTELNISIIQSLISCIVVLSIIPVIAKFIRSQREKISIDQLIIYQKEFSPNVLNIMKEAFPFGVAGLFYLIYYQFGIVFIRQMLGAKEAGFYGVAFTFLSASLIVPGVIYQKFLLPKLHSWAYHDREKFIQSYIYGNYVMLVLGILGLISLWFLAPYIVPLLFGDEYEAAILIVQIMAINIPIVYVASSAGSLLVTQDHMKTKVYYMGAAALMSLILTPILITFFGIYGAIYTNIASNIFICILYFNAVKARIINE
nr:oligosaccharide flippase family protein [Wohlfahrtiimonas chitiniclastica]